MSEQTDSTPARIVGQAQSLENATNVNSEQERFYKVYADIGELILAFLTGELFLSLAHRVALLSRAAFIPSAGSGNPAALAFCLGMKEKGASDLARRRNMPFVKPGDERIFSFSDTTKKFDKEEKSEDSVAHAKRKRIRKPKTSL